MKKTKRKSARIVAIVLSAVLLFTGVLAVPASASILSWLFPGIMTNPTRTTITNRIFLGDSRTVGMYTTLSGKYNHTIVATEDGEYWNAREGAGYSYFSSTAIPKAEEYGIRSGTAVYILFGVNDLSNESRYLELINKKAADWRAAGAKVYFVSVNPVNEQKCRTVTNASIEAFNAAMRSGLSRDVTYVDTYSMLYTDIAGDPDMTDRYGLHYHGDTYRKIYEKLKAS